MERRKPETVVNPFPPVYNAESRVLILGTMPSEASREAHFYYGNPRNRFWRVMARLLEENLPQTIEEKKEMLLNHGVALSDVLRSCEIRGSSDTSIRQAEPNSLDVIFGSADIQQVFANGKAAYTYYRKFSGRDIVYLPSTSPANASFSEEQLLEKWKAVLPYLRRSTRVKENAVI